MRRLLLALVALSAPLGFTACKKEEPAPAAPEIKWPAKPTDGSTVALVFKSFEGEGDRRQGVFDLFNFDERNLTKFVAMLEYLDADGKVIKDFPHTHMKLVGGKAVAEIKAGFFIPENAKSIRAVMRSTSHGAGEEWKAPEGQPAGAAPAAPASAAGSEAPAAPGSEAPAAPGSEAPAAPASAAE